MPYDASFWRLYEAYLNEPAVRANHGRALKHFEKMAWMHVDGAHEVVDLGCGLGEYRRFVARHGRMWYAGIDKEDATAHVPEAAFKPELYMNVPFVQGDYTDPATLDRLPFAPNAFVSLFSVEACLPVAERYALYRRMFQRFPELSCGVSAGFFYASKRDQETVEENGAIISYQSIDELYEHVDPLFDEERHLYRTPSAMFGDDVVEVWKFFYRRA